MTDGMPMSITFPQSRAGTDGKHARMGSSHRVWNCLGHEGGQPPTKPKPKSKSEAYSSQPVHPMWAEILVESIPASTALTQHCVGGRGLGLRVLHRRNPAEHGVVPCGSEISHDIDIDQ